MVNPQETISVAAQGMVYALTVSVFAQSLGLLMAGAELGVAPLGQSPTERGIKDLRATFGAAVVDKALKDVGKGDIITLAQLVEHYAWEDLEEKYGEHAVEVARRECAPGDFTSARQVAASISGRGVTPTSPPVAREQAVKVGKARGRRPAQPVRDKNTGIVYGSKAKAGMAVAAEYGLDPKNHFIWYEVIKKAPDRFVRV